MIIEEVKKMTVLDFARMIVETENEKPPEPEPPTPVKPMWTHPLTIKTVVLDAGHGAVDVASGNRSEAMTRVYKFPRNGQVVYEGDINRIYTREIKERLEKIGIEVVLTAPDYKDTPLSERVRISNQHDDKSAYFLSIHCNGSVNHTATGAEGFTTKGDNRSDDVMQCILSNMRGVTKLRSDNNDGDLDREYNYYVLRKTKLRAGLLELGFYDNWEEYTKLMSDWFVEKMSKAIVKGIVDYNDSLNNTQAQAY